MLLNVTNPIFHFRSRQPMQFPDGKAMTIGDVFIHALTEYADNASGEVKIQRVELAERIADAMEVNEEIALSVEERAQLKTIVGRMFVPVIVQQVWRALDPPDASAEK